MKKKTSVAIACLATVAAGVGFVPNGVYADASGLSRIYVYESSATSTTSCNLYYAGGEADCNETFGSYDAGNNVLTLGSGVNGKSVYIVDSSETGNTYTIKANSDISAAFSLPSYATINFDLENYSWTEPTTDSNFFNTPSYGKVVFNSGTFNFVDMLSANELEINGATINTSGTQLITTGNIKAKKFTMNSGIVSMENGDLEVDDSLDINGGTINVTNPYGSGGCIYIGSTNSTKLNMTGGVVTLDAEGYSRSGIYASSGKSNVVTISGGELIIKNTDNGFNIVGEGSKLNFNGGVTKIINSGTYAVDMRDTSDPENDIAFGSGMGILEPGVHVFWIDDNWTSSDDTNWTGIVASGETVTIAEGGTVVRHYGWEIGNNEKNDVKVPNTGVFSVENGGVMMAMISVGVLAAVSCVVYVVSYIAKRCKSGVRFNR